MEKRCTQGPGVTDKWLETQIHEGVSADVANVAVQRGYLFDFPWRLNGKNKIDHSISGDVLMENDSVMSRIVRKGPIRKSTIVRALRLWDRGGQLHGEGRYSLTNQPSFSAEAHGRRCPEREAQCRHRFPLGVGTGNLDQKWGFKISSVLVGYWFIRVWSTLSVVSSQAVVCRPGSEHSATCGASTRRARSSRRALRVRTTRPEMSEKPRVSASKPPLLIVQSGPRIFRVVTRSLRYVSSGEPMGSSLHVTVPHMEDNEDHDDGPNIQEVIEKQPGDFAWWDNKEGRGSLQLCEASSPTCHRGATKVPTTS